MKYFSMFSLQKVWYWKRHEIIEHTPMGVNSMIWNHWKKPMGVNSMIWNHWIKPHGVNSMISWYWINLKQHFKKECYYSLPIYFIYILGTQAYSFHHTEYSYALCCNSNHFFRNYYWKKLWHPQTSGWVSGHSHDVICHMSSPFKYLSNISLFFMGQHFHFWKIY